jgi:hypothetical protein
MTDQNPAPDVDAASRAAANAIRTANAVRDAFSMGWCIQELRSRVLLEAPDEQLVHDTSSNSSTTTADTAKAAAAHTTPAKTPVANSAPAPQSTLSNILGTLKTVFPSVFSPGSQTQDGQSSLNKSLTRTSLWRSLFVNIAATHSICFPDSTTKNTPYDPVPTPSLESHLPYLYPSSDPNYALIGVSNENTEDAALKNFILYDTTRRSLNCLTLLHTKPEESLVPDIICEYQRRIVAAIFSRTTVPDLASIVSVIAEGPTDVEQDLQVESTRVLHQYLNETCVGPSPGTLKTAIRILTFLTIRFLDSWDGYLRENFYVGGQLKNNELELQAYQAGRSLATLSYGTSLMISPLENDSDDALPDDQKKAVIEKIATGWTNIFDDAFINTIQRQISALGPSLDEGYYAFKNIHRPASGEKPAPDIPSRGIHAITYNLEYWQRTIRWMCSSPDATIAMWKQLRQTLIVQSAIWQSLILGEQTLRSFSTGTVTKKIINDLMGDFENALRQQSGNALDRYRVPLIVAAVVLLVVLGGGLVLLAIVGQLQSITAVIGLVVGSVVTFVTAALTRVGSVFSPTTNGKSSSAGTAADTGTVEQRLSGILGETEATAISIFQSAYKQILLEFDDLNHYVAISYPLADFFLNVQPDTQGPQIGQTMKDLDIFLTKIVWTSEEQQEEVKRIARSAFGPLALLLTPSAKQKPPVTQEGKG